MPHDFNNRCNRLDIKGRNTNYRVTGNFIDEQGGSGDYAIRIDGGKHEMTFSYVSITMSKLNSKAMDLRNTILDLVLDGSNTITYGGIWRVSSLITLPFLFPERAG